MTASSDPEEIRQEIERTRVELSDDVDTLAETAKPGQVARRQAGKVRGAAVRAKDKIMGSDTATQMRGTAQQLRDKAANGSNTAPDTIKRQTRGNPLAAGLVAFGVGMLVSAAIPSTRPEQQAATRLQEPLKEQATQTAKEVAQDLKQPAHEAARSVTDTAAEGAEQVKGEAMSATDQVKGQAQRSQQAVQDEHAD